MIKVYNKGAIVSVKIWQLEITFLSSTTLKRLHARLDAQQTFITWDNT